MLYGFIAFNEIKSEKIHFPVRIDVSITKRYIYMSNIVFKYQSHSTEPSTSGADCVCLVDNKIWRNLPNPARDKTLEVVQSIANGTPFPSLGGRIVKCNPSLVRFRIGRSLRLILLKEKDRFTFKLCQRQGYERYFKHLS